MLTPDERAEFTELASAYLAAVKQIELHGQAVAGGRAAAGSLLVTLMARLLAKYPVSGFTCQDYLFALIPHEGKQLLYVSPLGTTGCAPCGARPSLPGGPSPIAAPRRACRWK